MHVEKCTKHLWSLTSHHRAGPFLHLPFLQMMIQACHQASNPIFRMLAPKSVFPDLMPPLKSRRPSTYSHPLLPSKRHSTLSTLRHPSPLSSKGTTHLADWSRISGIIPDPSFLALHPLPQHVLPLLPLVRVLNHLWRQSD